MLYTEGEVIDRAIVNVSVTYRGSKANAEVRVLWPPPRAAPEGSNPEEIMPTFGLNSRVG